MTPKDLNILSIKNNGDLILDEDSVDLKSNYFKDNTGLRPGGDTVVFQRDYGTIARVPCPPIRPNVFKVISGAASASGLIRITATSHGYSNSDTVYIDEVVGTVEAIGKWVISGVTTHTFDLVGSAFVHTYTSGGIASKTPITISHGYTFYDKDTQSEYEIVAGKDSSDNLRLYVYDSASTEKSKWIELTRNYTATIKTTPSATAKTIDIENVKENGITSPETYPYADGSLDKWIVLNTTQSNETAFITNSVYGSFGVLTTDTVLGANGLAWVATDVIQIYRFPAIKFNYTFAHGATPSVSWLEVTQQRKLIFFHQHTDGTKYQALQIMRRNVRNYFYDSSTTTYLRTLLAGWYVESDFGILNPYATTYGSVASPKSPGGGNFTTLAASGASNAAPIVVTVPSTAGLTTGDIVVGSGFTTNTNANHLYSITVVNGTTFQLDASTGNGATTAGSIAVYKNIGQIYDKTAGRNWLNLYGNLSNGSTAKATGQIIFNAPTNNDTVHFFPEDGTGGVDYTKKAVYNAGAREFTSADELVSMFNTDWNLASLFRYVAVNSGGTITITANFAGSKYNFAGLVIGVFNVGTLAISNVSQGATAVPSSVRDLEGGIDTTAVYSQGRVYVTAGYGGYEESDPILQAFLQGDTSTTPPDLLLTPYLSFALMNKELTHLYMYAVFQNSTIVQKGWKNATKEYILHFSLPIQSATTDTDYLATEWTDQSAVLKSLQGVYGYDISQLNKMEASATNYDTAVNAGAVNINDELNHAVDMERTYPTPRFATTATRNDGAIILIDDGDLSGRLSSYNGSGDHEDDNFPDVRNDNNKNKLKIPFKGTGEILGLNILSDIIHVFRKSTIETYDLQGVFMRTYKADVCAKKSILATPYGIIYGGNASIFIIPIDGSAIVSLNPLWDNYYSGNQFVTGTTQYVTSTYRNDMIAGYNDLYKELWMRLKVNTATSTEIRCFRYSFERGNWYVRILNVTDDIRYFSKNIGDTCFTIGTEKSILKYPNRSGANIYQDDVRVNGSALEISQSLIVPTSFEMNIALFNAKIIENALNGFKLDFTADSSDGYGLFNVDFYANRETVSFDPHLVRSDEIMEYREIDRRGAIDRLSIKISLDSTSTVGRLDLAELDLGFLPNKKLQNL
jgi:hypothetical protein